MFLGCCLDRYYRPLDPVVQGVVFSTVATVAAPCRTTAMPHLLPRTLPAPSVDKDPEDAHLLPLPLASPAPPALSLLLRSAMAAP